MKVTTPPGILPGGTEAQGLEANLTAIGIMGGTFDPIHCGHLILAEQAREALGLDKVLFVTAADPPHKPGQVATAARNRHEMACLAVESNDCFACSTVEIDRPGPSYTIDTVRQIMGIYDGVRVYLLVGADEARNLMTWRDPVGIQKLATIVVANRPGYPVADSLEALPEDFAKSIRPLEMPGVDISSTDIRARVRSRRSIKYLVPKAVENYIVKHALYAEPG